MKKQAKYNKLVNNIQVTIASLWRQLEIQNPLERQAQVVFVKKKNLKKIMQTDGTLYFKKSI